MRALKVAGVVLAAGFSRRLGRAKQELVLGGETLLARAVRVAGEAGLTPVIAVVREDAPEAGANGCVVVRNAMAAEGMGSSIRCGVAEAERSGAAGVVLMTCDQPAVTVAHLRALMRDTAVATGSGYAGKVGVPAYFPAACFARLLELRGDVGAREMLREARSIAAEELAWDVDSEAEWAAVQKYFGEDFLA